MFMRPAGLTEGALKTTMLLVGAVVAFSSLPAFGQVLGGAPPGITEQERQLEEAQRTDVFPLGVGVSLGQSMSAATFNRDEYVRRASYDLSLGVSPYWRITPMLRLTAGISVSQSVIENYDSSVTYRHRMLLSDTSLGLSYARIVVIPGIDVNVGGSLGCSFPTSIQSRYRTLYMSSRAGLSLSRAAGPLFISYGFSFFKNFNEYDQPAVDTGEEQYVVLAHFRGHEQLTTDLIATGGANTSFGIMNSLMVSWGITDELSLTVMYGLNQSWTYRSFPDDEYKAELADAGRGYRDAQSGTIDVSYQLDEHLGISAGVDTATAPKTADNQAWIFPFANFWDRYRNNTSIYLGVGGNF
jgi:hypothetical protein